MGGIEVPDIEIVHDGNVFGYRNKAQYGFAPDPGGDGLSLALHRRGAMDLFPIGTCALAKENINKAALHVLERLNETGARAGDLKSLVLRESRGGEVIASLMVANKRVKSPENMCGDLLSGFHLYFDDPQPRAPRPLQPLGSKGSAFMTEELAGKIFKCGPLSFFQVNVPIFEKALSRMASFIGADEEIVDFYSGVGAIGIALGNEVKGGVLVESNREASSLAGENIEINGLKNFSARVGSAEKMLREIEQDRTIIFDPPRAGLHPQVVGKVLEELPRKIIYLACDVATQARDLGMLTQKYQVTFCELYNFFPRTPHIESLVVLCLP